MYLSPNTMYRVQAPLVSMHMCCGFRRAVSPAVKKTDDHRSFVNDKILKHHKRHTMIYSNDKEQREMHAIPGGQLFLCVV